MFIKYLSRLLGKKPAAPEKQPDPTDQERGKLKLEALLYLIEHGDKIDAINIEDIDKSDIGIKLSTIFPAIEEQYVTSMALQKQRRNTANNSADNIIEHPTKTQLEETRQFLLDELMAFPETEEELLDLFAKGRELRKEKMPSPTVRQYLDTKNAVNTVLKTRGIDLKVQ